MAIIRDPILRSAALTEQGQEEEGGVPRQTPYPGDSWARQARSRTDRGMSAQARRRPSSSYGCVKPRLSRTNHFRLEPAEIFQHGYQHLFDIVAKNVPPAKDQCKRRQRVRPEQQRCLGSAT
jgi:hypothetical protein